MELVDALCSYPEAQSVVELSLSPYFRRGHAALYEAIADYKWKENDLAHLAAPYLLPPAARPFWLLGADVTPQPRPFSPTLEDRSMVHQPNLVKGNKPVTIGHQYSTVGLLPEAEAEMSESNGIIWNTSSASASRNSSWLISKHPMTNAKKHGGSWFI